MTPEELRARTKAFAIGIVKLYLRLPSTDVGRILGRQLLRSGTSVGANYRAACLGRSKAEFIAKLCIVLEEADETVFWLELLVDSGILTRGQDSGLCKEATELARIFGASLRTARASSITR